MTPGEMDRVIDAHLGAERLDDVEAIIDTVSDDIVHELFGAGLDQLRGKDAVRAFYKQLGQDLRIDGYPHHPPYPRRGSCLGGRGRARHGQGRPFGFEGGGRSVAYQLNHLFEFRNGLICRELGIPDGASILRQVSQPA